MIGPSYCYGVSPYRARPVIYPGGMHHGMHGGMHRGGGMHHRHC